MTSEATDLAKIADKLTSKNKPLDREPADCGPFDIRITTDGRWHYRGSLIERKPLVKLFSSVLMCDENGQFWLRTPAEKGLIEVDDAPFVIVDMSVEAATSADQIVRLTTNIDEIVTLDRDHRLRVAVNTDTGEPRPYVMVRDNLEGRIGRAVYYDLAALAEIDPTGARYGVRSAGLFHDLGPVAAD